jgi:hypothetical protein
VKCTTSQIPLKQPAQSVLALKLKLEEALHSQDKTKFKIITKKKKKTLELDSAIISMSQMEVIHILQLKFGISTCNLSRE